MIKHGIFKEVTRDLGIAVLVAAGIAALGFCAPADAQVVQPQYVRPSKGARVPALTSKTVQNNATASCPIANACLSAVYDMTAFDAVQIYVLRTSTQQVIEGPWVVPNLPPFIKIRLISQTTGAPPYASVSVFGSSASNGQFSAFSSTDSIHAFTGVVPGDVIDVVVVPIPFSDVLAVTGSGYSGQTFPSGVLPSPLLVGGIASVGGALTADNTYLDGYSSGGRYNALNVNVTNASAAPIPVKPVPSTTAIASAATAVAGVAVSVHSSSATHCSVSVVNAGINPIWCSQTNAVTTANGITLNPATFAGLTGGSVTFDNYGGDVYCIATVPAPSEARTQVVTCP